MRQACLPHFAIWPKAVVISQVTRRKMCMRPHQGPTYQCAYEGLPDTIAKFFVFEMPLGEVETVRREYDHQCPKYKITNSKSVFHFRTLMIYCQRVKLDP